ncbi:esterase of the alpha-beta hydrolase superfamily protein, putative [Babesia ovata]|uniref:Esterase of the alpha-beta hydrolase superfamily protein, putative n=1 Tax=Babesia ovata TaxID=189622 RepID=A0A2H6KFY5_9APIC|nr:esterase of the alpha-beta hydrolase superfamily protein, putative [Babesia ovata]GBE61908.1 esterase of the alpha-beta hydrolase superfamily protein, putative [Babesia ovata]
MASVFSEIFFSNDDFVKYNKWCNTCPIIPPNVPIKQTFKSWLETSCPMSDAIMRSYELLHEIIFTAKHNWTLSITYHLGRPLNRRPGCSPDLLFSFIVESLKSGFKAFNFFLKIFCDFVLEFLRNCCINLFLQITQSTVHGLGGAFLVGRRKGIVCRRGKLTVKCPSNRCYLVQDFCDVCVCWLEQHRIQFVAHLAGHRGHDNNGGGDGLSEDAFLVCAL